MATITGVTKYFFIVKDHICFALELFKKVSFIILLQRKDSLYTFLRENAI